MIDLLFISAIFLIAFQIFIIHIVVKNIFIEKEIFAAHEKMKAEKEKKTNSFRIQKHAAFSHKRKILKRYFPVDMQYSKNPKYKLLAFDNMKYTLFSDYRRYLNGMNDDN